MTTITLARALKLKNRLVGQLAKLGGRFAAHNSHREGTKNPYNASDVLVEYVSVQAQLVEVKTKIQLANALIVEKIVEIGEFRSQISLFQGLNVAEGTVPANRWDSDKEVVHNYLAAVGAEVRDRTIEGLELSIDVLQDEIDTHNATTKIDLSFAL